MMVTVSFLKSCYTLIRSWNDVCSTLVEMSYSDTHKEKMYANPLTRNSLYIMDYFILQNAVKSPAS